MTISTDAIVFLGPLALIFAALGPGLWAWTLHRFSRFRANLPNELGARGYAVRTMDVRWLTRGPFPHPALARRRRKYLLRVFAEDRAGKPHSGWVRWHAPLPWRSAIGLAGGIVLFLRTLSAA